MLPYPIPKIERSKMPMKSAISILLLISLLLSMLISAGCSRRSVYTATAMERLELAIKYLSEDNFEQAILAFHAVLEIDPRNIDAYKGLAGAYVMSGKPEEAKQILQDGMEEVEAPTVLKLALAGVYTDTGEAARAEDIIRELTAMTPINLSAYRAYKHLLLEQNRTDEAIELLLLVAEQDDVPYQIYTMLAEVHMQNNDREQALLAIRQSIMINSKQATAYRQLTEIFLDEPDSLIAWGQGQDDSFLAELTALIAQYTKGDYLDITANFTQLSDETRANTWAIIVLAKAHMRLDEDISALATIKTIDTASINCAFLLAELAKLFFVMGETEKIIRQAQGMNLPDWMLRALSDSSTAIRLAQQGIEADDSIEENFILLYMLYRNTDGALAKLWLTKQLINSPFGFFDAKEKQERLISVMGIDILEEVIVYIPDDGLESAIRMAINKPTGEITAYDLAQIRELDANQRGITDLTGLEFATNLSSLYLLDNQVIDISALSGLINMNLLLLAENQITDLSALRDLTNLTRLFLWHNQITDISVIEELTNLTELCLLNNQISDISVLQNLDILTILCVSGNPLSEESQELLEALRERNIKDSYDNDHEIP